MISIITAIYNGLLLNKLFNESLKKYTFLPYELIIIDNGSTDGSRQYFEKEGAIVIKNEHNYSYPYCQNQGIKVAGGEYLFFLNNDLIVCPDWDKLMIMAAVKNGLEVISAADNGRTGNFKEDQSLSRKWKRCKNLIYAGFGITSFSLNLMLKAMYGNWEVFCQQRTEQYGEDVVEGLVGANVMMTRSAIEKIGRWDERIQAADLDLELRIKERQTRHGDIKSCHIVRGAFIHHFNRMTVKYAETPPPFKDETNLISLKEKWGEFLGKNISLHYEKNCK